jgi:hypothetical protein
MSTYKSYQNGNEIKIKPKWQDEGDEKYAFIVIEDYPTYVKTKVEIPNFSFPTIQSIEKHMIIGEPDNPQADRFSKEGDLFKG